MLTKPKDKGGVGIVNFKKKNDALLMKYLDKFYNRANIPWVNLIRSSYYDTSVPHAGKLCGSFWWRDIFKLVEDYCDVSFVKPSRGDSFLFWSDKWMFNGSIEPLSPRFPRLFSYVLDPKISATQFYQTDDNGTLFHLPLSEQAYDEFNQLSLKWLLALFLWIGIFGVMIGEILLLLSDIISIFMLISMLCQLSNGCGSHVV
jgi:hypothetical protein